MADGKVTVLIGADYQGKRAFQEAGGDVQKFASQAGEMAKKLLEFVAIEEAARRLIEFGKSTLEAEANLAHMSERTGVAVEQLSEMAYAANQTGVETDVFEKGVRKLQQTIASAAAGNEKAASSLRAVGVSARDSSGNLTSASAALASIAGKFTNVADGTSKAAAASAVFGARMGTQMIPVLNRGTKGLQELYDEAHRVGKVMSGEDKEAVLEFEENMKKLKATGEGLMQHFIAGFAPEINKIATALSGPGKDGFDDVRDAGEFCGDVIKLLVLGFASLVIGVEFLAVKLGHLADAFGLFTSGDFVNASKAINQFFGSIEDKKADELAAKLGRINQALFPDEAAAKKRAKKTTDTIDDAAQDADRIFKQQLANDMDAQRLAADFAKSMNDIRQKNLDEMYKHDLISVTDYYAKKKALAADTLAAEIYAAHQEYLALDAALKRAPSEEERLRVLNQINKVSERQSVLEMQLGALQNRNIKGEVDPLLQKAEAMEIYGAAAAKLAQQIEIVLSQLKQDEEEVAAKVDNYQVTAMQGEQQVNDLRATAHEKLQAMVTDYRQLADASGDPKLVDSANKYGKQLDQLSIKVDTVKKDLIATTESGLTSFFTALEDGSKTGKAAFADFGKSLLATMNQIIAKMFVVWMLQKLLGWATGGSGASLGGGGALADSTLAGVGDSEGPPTFLAQGGRMRAGQLGVVGDGGEPELWVPDTAGTVVPFSKMPSAAQTTNVFDFRGADPGSEARIMQQIKQVGIWARAGAVSDVRELRLRGAM